MSDCGCNDCQSLEILKGDKGDTGLPGQRGAMGATGATGATGTDGRTFPATSVTNLTIGTGSKTLTIVATYGTQTAFNVGERMRVTDSADTTKFMLGTVTAFNAGTGVTTFLVDTIGGAGNISTWNINLGGEAPAAATNLLPLDNVWSGINEFDSTILEHMNITDILIVDIGGGVGKATIPGGQHGNVFNLVNTNNVPTLQFFSFPDNVTAGISVKLVIKTLGTALSLKNNTSTFEGISVLNGQEVLQAGDIIEITSTNSPTYCWKYNRSPKYNLWQDPSALGIYGTDQFGNAFINDPTTPIRFRKEGNVLRITGKINNGTPSALCNAPTVLMTLPAAYRPAASASDPYFISMDTHFGVPISMVINHASGDVTILYNQLAGAAAYNTIVGTNYSIRINTTIALD